MQPKGSKTRNYSCSWTCGLLQYAGAKLVGYATLKHERGCCLQFFTTSGKNFHPPYYWQFLISLFLPSAKISLYCFIVASGFTTLANKTYGMGCTINPCFQEVKKWLQSKEDWPSRRGLKVPYSVTCVVQHGSHQLGDFVPYLQILKIQ